jgi:hypothetical protein
MENKASDAEKAAKEATAAAAVAVEKARVAREAVKGKEKKEKCAQLEREAQQAAQVAEEKASVAALAAEDVRALLTSTVSQPERAYEQLDLMLEGGAPAAPTTATAGGLDEVPAIEEFSVIVAEEEPTAVALPEAERQLMRIEEDSTAMKKAVEEEAVQAASLDSAADSDVV